MVEKVEEVAERFLGNQNNRLGVGRNVPFKAVDALQHFIVPNARHILDSDIKIEPVHELAIVTGQFWDAWRLILLHYCTV